MPGELITTPSPGISTAVAASKEMLVKAAHLCALQQLKLVKKSAFKACKRRRSESHTHSAGLLDIKGRSSIRLWTSS